MSEAEVEIEQSEAVQSPPSTKRAKPEDEELAEGEESKPEKKPAAKRAKKDDAGKPPAKADTFELPATTIHRIIKAALPDGVMVSKDAKTAFNKAATIFVYYITNW